MNNIVAIQFPNRQDFDYFVNQNSLTANDISSLVHDIANDFCGDTRLIYLELTTFLEEIPNGLADLNAGNSITVYI